MIVIRLLSLIESCLMLCKSGEVCTTPRPVRTPIQIALDKNRLYWRNLHQALVYSVVFESLAELGNSRTSVTEVFVRNLNILHFNSISCFPYLTTVCVVYVFLLCQHLLQTGRSIKMAMSRRSSCNFYEFWVSFFGILNRGNFRFVFTKCINWLILLYSNFPNFRTR